MALTPASPEEGPATASSTPKSQGALNIADGELARDRP